VATVPPHLKQVATVPPHLKQVATVLPHLKQVATVLHPRHLQVAFLLDGKIIVYYGDRAIKQYDMDSR
jgi:hypothetical protein